MSGAIMTAKNAVDAANALKEWFQSQEMEPCDAIMTCETFFAMMIAENSKGPDDDRGKLALLVETINTFIPIIRAHRK